MREPGQIPQPGNALLERSARVAAFALQSDAFAGDHFPERHQLGIDRDLQHRSMGIRHVYIGAEGPEIRVPARTPIIEAVKTLAPTLKDRGINPHALPRQRRRGMPGGLKQPVAGPE